MTTTETSSLNQTRGVEKRNPRRLGLLHCLMARLVVTDSSAAACRGSANGAPRLSIGNTWDFDL